jgi:hypothetical protein
MVWHWRSKHVNLGGPPSGESTTQPVMTREGEEQTAHARRVVGLFLAAVEGGKSTRSPLEGSSPAWQQKMRQTGGAADAANGPLTAHS